jgi:hypothetical protein
MIVYYYKRVTAIIIIEVIISSEIVSIPIVSNFTRFLMDVEFVFIFHSDFLTEKILF